LTAFGANRMPGAEVIAAIGTTLIRQALEVESFPLLGPEIPPCDTPGAHCKEKKQSTENRQRRQSRDHQDSYGGKQNGKENQSATHDARILLRHQEGKYGRRRASATKETRRTCWHG